MANSRQILRTARSEASTARKNLARKNYIKKTSNGSNTSPFSLKLRLLTQKTAVRLFPLWEKISRG